MAPPPTLLPWRRRRPSVLLLSTLALLCFFRPALTLPSTTESSTAPATDTAAASTKPRTYIVHMAKSEMPATFSTHHDWYASALSSVSTAATTQSGEHLAGGMDRLLYTYDTAFHGFAARMTASEADILTSTDGVLAIYPDEPYHLHTTRSPGFLGLEAETTARAFATAAVDHDVFVGVLDTGIWPESPSFDDRGLPPVPSRWKGACEVGRGFTRAHCNRKIVGARTFYRGYEAATGGFDDKAEYRSPRDEDGHGTHTAATAAGVAVPRASLLGYATGTAKGMAPRARVAAYKVCWKGGCFSSDILSAVDRAVADGVDVLSISLGGGVSSYSRDSLSVAAYGAMEAGVFVACSAGNGGPDPISLTNVSPWIATIGASTMDRDFPATAHLGNGLNISGVSLYKGRRNLLPNKQYPVVYFGAANSTSADPKSLCMEGTLDAKSVAGKIVLCDRGVSPRVQKGQVVKDAGGIGMILANTETNGDELVADAHLLPAVAVGSTVGKTVRRYALSTPRPTATLTFSGTKLGIRPSPIVAAFSSRGPNFLTLEILKPDMVAPGVNILAAWSGAASPSSLTTDKRRVGFNILSGTSMSCPHVAGVAALIKAAHPDWSPSAIKSALMTTAYVHDNMFAPLKDASKTDPATPYDYGAGHIRPAKALDPGLVYDITPSEYFEFLCTQKLTPMQIRVFTKSANRTCRGVPMRSAGDLNYPAISAVVPEKLPKGGVTVTRTVTNVGQPNSNYHVVVSPFKGAAVTVEPKVLRFTRKNQKLSYKVTFGTKVMQTKPEFGGLVWKDGVHTVRIPIVVTWLAGQ